MQKKWEVDPENPPSLESQPLGPEELDAKAHWQRFLPNLVKQLEAQGPLALDQAIRAAAWRTEYHVLLAQVQNPTLHPMEAEQLFRHEWLFPPPEG